MSDNKDTCSAHGHSLNAALLPLKIIVLPHSIVALTWDQYNLKCLIYNHNLQNHFSLL